MGDTSTATPAEPPPDAVPEVRRIRKVVISGTIGSALEWFDFALYGAVSATIFPALFFADLGQYGAILASFGTFAVGFIARPIGAVICGYLGDRYGRRPVLVATFVVMGVASVGIGALPAGQGPVIATILVLLRFLQGLSLGGEATGAQLMTMEYAGPRRRALYGSFINSGSPISQVLANMSLLVLGAVLTDAQFEAWGWRIPFLLSVVLVIVGLYIRMRLEETPVFLANQVTAATESGPRVNGLQVLKTYPRRVLLLMFVRAGSNVTFYTMSVYYLSYLTSQGVVSKSMAFTIIMVANGIAVCFSILGGLVSDAIGRKSVLYIAIAGQLVAVAAFLPAVHTGAALLIMAAVTLAVSSVQFEWGGAQAALYAEQFPTSMRFSGSALAMTFSQVLFSAPAPLVAAAIASTGVFWAIPAVNIGVLLVSVACIPWLQDRRNVPLSDIAEPMATHDVPYAQPESAPELNATGR